MRLFELINRTPNAHGDAIIAFRGDYWIVDSEEDRKIAMEISRKTGMDIEDVISSWPILSQERPDIISGYLNNGILEIDGSIDAHHPATSNMLKKIKNELHLKGIHVNGQPDIDYDETGEFFNSEIRGTLPRKLYHGTNFSALWNIARFGLRPNSGSNWEKAGIQHNNLIFGTTDFSTAVFHANHSLGINDDSGYMDFDDDFPVVIEFLVPDKNKLHPDYDVANQTMGNSEYADHLGYTGIRDYGRMTVDDIVKANPEGRHWKNTAAFAYEGRIPAKFITNIFTNFYDPPYMNNDPKFSGTLKEFFDEYRMIHDFDEDE